MDATELQTVVEDLEYLQNGWGPEIANPDIRRGSAVLRSLLVENVYSRAWRSVGFERQPSVIAVDIDKLIGGETDLVVCCLAWGAHFRGLYMASPLINEGGKPIGDASAPLRENGYPGEREYHVSEFMESTAGIAGRLIVKRREIIKYVANVKGGVHLGQKAKAAERKLVNKLAKFENRIQAHTTDGVFVELVAIAQAVGLSDDAAKLIDAIRN